MAGTLRGAAQHIAHPFLNDLPGSEQQCGIEIALDAALVADTRPGIIQVYAPIHANDIAAGFGIRAVIQPGGSMRDAEVIAAADEHDMAMVFTTMRHFRH